MRALRPLLIAALTLLSVEGAARVALAVPSTRERLAAGSSEGRRLVRVLSWRALRDKLPDDAAGLSRLAHDPGLGWRARPGAHDVDGVLATADAAGRRVTPEAPANAPRVLLVGDSFTFGEEVTDDATFAWRLGALTGWGVTNAGVPSYGLDQAVLRLDEVLADASADVALLCVTSPMWTRSLATFDAWRKPRFVVDDAGDLRLTGVPVPSPAEEAAALSPLRSFDLLRVWMDLLRHPLMDPEASLAVNTRLLTRALGAATSAGVPLRVVWMPLPDEIAAGGSGDAAAPFVAWCRDHGDVCLDLTPALTALPPGTGLSRGAHWSPRVHDAVAEALATALAPLLTPPEPP